jgi:glycosyltransferase involved in cell wall biosynthesis
MMVVDSNQNGSSDHESERQMKSHNGPKISIIMPVYNGSFYLRETLNKILEQTFSEYEVICINDCSTDNSLKILEEYSARDERFRVFSTNANKGIVPKVMNYAIPYVRGNYFVYTSQDDLFSKDWLQSMYDKAVSADADAVIPDVVLYYENEPQKNCTLSALCRDKNRVLTNREAVVLSLDWSIPGNALWAVRLLKDIRYYDFSMNADEYTARVYFLNCNKIVFSGGTFYYRQDNNNAITKKLSENAFDYPYTDFRLFEFLRENEFPVEVQEAIALRSIYGLARLKMVLYKYKVRKLIPMSSGSLLFSSDGAERRVRGCFGALQSVDVLRCISSMTGWKARLAKIMLTDYTLFTAISFLAFLAKLVNGRWKKLIIFLATRVLQRT